VRRHEDDLVLCVANLSSAVQPAELDLSAFAGMTPVEMMGLTDFPKIGTLPYFLTLPPYYFYWFRLQTAPMAALRPSQAAAPAESMEATLPALLMSAIWESLLDGNVRTLLEREALVPFLQRQDWFAGKTHKARAARFVDWGVLRGGEHPVFMTIVEVDYKDASSERYLVPLAIVAGPAADAILSGSPHVALARITGARKGLVVDGTAGDAGAHTLLDALESPEAVVRMKHGTVRVHRAPGDARGSRLIVG
jgi:maltose alpha-D-glucosyltransferase/alpha-amylase